MVIARVKSILWSMLAIPCIYLLPGKPSKLHKTRRPTPLRPAASPATPPIVHENQLPPTTTTTTHQTLTEAGPIPPVSDNQQRPSFGRVMTSYFGAGIGMALAFTVVATALKAVGL